MPNSRSKKKSSSPGEEEPSEPLILVIVVVVATIFAAAAALAAVVARIAFFLKPSHFANVVYRKADDVLVFLPFAQRSDAFFLNRQVH